MNSKAMLDELHRELCAYLTERLKESKERDPETGRILMPMAAAELSVLRQFLKDNGIQADKDHADDLMALQEQLRNERSETERKSIMDAAIHKLAEDSEMMH